MFTVKSPLTHQQFINIVKLFELVHIDISEKGVSIQLNADVRIWVSKKYFYSYGQIISTCPKTKVGIGFYFDLSKILEQINNKTKE